MKLYRGAAGLYYVYKGVTIYVNGMSPMGYHAPGRTTYTVKGAVVMTLPAAKALINNLNSGKGY